MVLSSVNVLHRSLTRIIIYLNPCMASCMPIEGKVYGKPLCEISLAYKEKVKLLILHKMKRKPMKMTHIWKWPNEKDLLYEKNLRLTLTLQTQERSFKTVYNLMIKEKTITNCRISAERGQSLHRLWSILYLPELFFSNDFFCMNNQTKCFWRC